jgi:hypothetical protein
MPVCPLKASYPTSFQKVNTGLRWRKSEGIVAKNAVNSPAGVIRMTMENFWESGWVQAGILVAAVLGAVVAMMMIPL